MTTNVRFSRITLNPHTCVY